MREPPARRSLIKSKMRKSLSHLSQTYQAQTNLHTAHTQKKHTITHKPLMHKKAHNDIRAHLTTAGPSKGEYSHAHAHAHTHTRTNAHAHTHKHVKSIQITTALSMHTYRHQSYRATCAARNEARRWSHLSK